MSFLATTDRAGVTERLGPGGTLIVSVEMVGEEAVLVVRGEVNYLTAPDLETVLGAVIDLLPASGVVVDLAQCEYMDSSGMKMIATAANSLEARGATLVIRSPPTVVKRLAGIMGLAELVDGERPEPIPVRSDLTLRPGLDAGPHDVGGDGVGPSGGSAVFRRSAPRTRRSLLRRAEAAVGSIRRSPSAAGPAADESRG